MLNNFFSVVAGVILLVTTLPAKAAEINTKLSVKVDDNGSLTVTNRYLSNYVFRGQGEDSTQSGPAIVLKRNKQAIDFSTIADFEWDGLLPSIDFQIPEFSSETTTIDLDAYDFPSGSNWEDSELLFRGANLGGLVLNGSDNREQSIDQLLLFFLNTIAVSEVAAEALVGNDDILPEELTLVLDGLRPLAEAVQDYQSYLQNAEDVLALTEVIIEQADRFLAAADIEPTVFPEIQTAYDYIDNFSSALNSLGVQISVSDSTRAARTGLIKEQYEILVEETVDDAIEAAIADFSSTYAAAGTDTERQQLIYDYLIKPLFGTLKLYAKSQKDQLTHLRSSGAAASVIEAQEGRVDFAENAISIARLAQLIFATDNFAEIARENPSVLISALFDAAYIVGSRLITIDNIEILRKNALQKATGADGRGVAFESIRKVSDQANAAMRALQLGSNIGNKMIPLIWDVVLGENLLRTSIIDGKVSTLGGFQTVVNVKVDNGQTRQFSSSQESQNHFIAADPNEIIELEASLFRPDSSTPTKLLGKQTL